MANSDPLSCQPSPHSTVPPVQHHLHFQQKILQPNPNPISLLFNGYQGFVHGGVKWPRCDADHSPQSNVQVNTTSGPKHHLPLYTLMNSQRKLYLQPHANSRHKIWHDNVHLWHFLLLAGDCVTVAGVGVARFWADFSCAIFSTSDFRSWGTSICEDKQMDHLFIKLCSSRWVTTDASKYSHHL